MRMTRVQEQGLIREAVAGDRRAAGALIEAHQQPLYAYLLRMSSRPELAEDIVQEAFVRVLANLDRFDDRYRFSTWLFTIAKRLYVNYCQKHAPCFDTGIVDSARDRTGARPEAPTIQDEVLDNTRDALGLALQGLHPDQREIVVLFHQHNWPIAIIARHMDMPEGTIKSHLHRGRRRLRQLIEQNERSARLVREVWT